MTRSDRPARSSPESFTFEAYRHFHLRQACKARLVFMHFANRWAGGYNLAKIVRYFDGVMLLCYATPEDTRRAIEAARKKAGEAVSLVAGFHAYSPATPDVTALREQVCAARSQDVTDLNFYNYGIMPRQNLGWIQAAIQAP